MNDSVKRLVWLVIVSLVGCNLSMAQGYAGLGSAAGQGFTMPQRGHALSFPRDHGSHDDFRIEWWYVTANLKGADGKDYGVQWTLFRSAQAPGDTSGWSSPQIWMAHAAVTTADHHYVAEKFARGGIGQAGVTVSPFAAWIDDWAMTGLPTSGDSLSSLSLKAAGDDFGFDLTLSASGPLVLQGENGYSVKSAAGQASYYYSRPFYTVQGRLHLPAGDVPVSGKAWADREWSSQPLAADQKGWDWFSLHFDGGAKLMGYHLRGKDSDYTVATWVNPDGTTQLLKPGALKLTPLKHVTVAGRDMPVEWRLELPEKGLDIATQPLNTQSWMAVAFPYWEGPIRFSGSASGVGYLEMTGY
ncbi:lipocalin-like domain-containing protein [Rhizobium sp.]|jgi:predicted secreted hydrolase|uniref:lipocalin-like domain-containing protein n=1 Tax=Rhizobium sp. TaxID=391 RepID=UPI000E9AD62C|nr:iron ABC transporter permease [Rhizobium sp.]